MRRDALRLDGIKDRHPSIGPGVLARGTHCSGPSTPECWWSTLYRDLFFSRGSCCNITP